ncbi:MAG: HEPN domain-containing protein [Thermodesulfobacteriota bacterium]
MERDELIRFWLLSSDADFQAMDTLFQRGHHFWTLVSARQLLEKLLKAFYVKKIEEEAPEGASLLEIAEKGALDLSEEQREILVQMDLFDLRERSPKAQSRLYEKATRKFTEYYFNRITELRPWLIRKISV